MATHYFASHRGGIEIVAEELFRGLAVSGQEVVWIAGDCTPPPDPIGASHAIGFPVFNWFELVTGLPFPIPTLRALSRIRRSVRKSDLVILHDCLYLSNIVTFLMARLSGRPAIVVQHVGSIPYENPALSALLKLANKTVTHWMLSDAQQVIFISETTRGFFSKLPYRNPPQVIFNGVDAELYHCCGTAEEKRRLRREYDLPE